MPVRIDLWPLGISDSDRDRIGEVKARSLLKMPFKNSPSGTGVLLRDALLTSCVYEALVRD